MMRMRVDTSRIEKYAKKMEGARKQVPYAIKLTLDELARKSMEELRADLKGRFITRGDWTWKTIRYRKASKKSPASSSVYTFYEQLKNHVDGGKKSGRDGVTAVPVMARKTPQARTRPATFPERLLAKPDYFARPLADGDVGVFRRKGRRKSTGQKRKARVKPERIDLYWVLMKTVRIKGAWPWRKITQQVYDREAMDLFETAWILANWSAR